jgi:diguanylate cyclase (GGDEF)-like protein/PAS domain S-box-containing protein
VWDPADGTGEEQRVTPRTVAGRGVGRLVAFAAVTFVAVLVGRATNLQATGLSLIWPAAGVIVLWWHEVRTRGQAVVTAAALAVVITAGNLATGAAFVITAVFLAVNLVHAVVGAEVLRRWCGHDRLVLRRVRDLAGSGLAAIAAGLASSTVALLGTTVVDELPTWTSAGLVLVRNTASTFLLIVLVAGARSTWSHPDGKRTAEGVAMVGVTVALCLVLFGLEFTFPLAFSLLTVTAWSALRLGVRWTAVHAAVASVAVIVLTLRGHGVFGALAPTSAVLVAQTFLVVLAAVGLSIALLHDELAAATAQERVTARRLSATIDAALVGNATVGLHGRERGRLLAVNPALAAILGASVDELVGTDWKLHVSGDDRALLDEVLAELRRGAIKGWSGELCHTTPGGEGRWAEVAVARIDDDGPPRASVQVLDITERKELEADLTHLALHDVLTELPNRALLLDRLTVSLADDEREGTHTAVLFLDIDDFKLVNDSLGHGAGDRVLVAVGRRLSQVVRPGDTVARIGGDEFVVCFPRIRDVGEAVTVAERTLASLQKPVHLSTGPVAVGISGGLALSAHGDTARGLLRRSDTAMYAAKDRGRGRVELFSDELRARATRHLRIRADLEGALDRHEIVCHYQPLVDLRTDRIVGAEALVRWHHVGRGLLLPADWLDVAEENGAIVPIGGHVLREACGWAAHRAEEGRPLTVHVNVSGRQLADSGTVEQVLGALEESGLDAARLVLELTETHFLETHRSLVRDLETLRRRGVHLSADDFGTGFSSLSQLLQLPLDQVKIDRTFVASVRHDQRSAAIVRGLIGLAEGLELEVVAEGVESEAQAARLLELGCPTGQGLLWSPAVPGDAWPWSDSDDRTLRPRIDLSTGDPDEAAPTP